MPGNADVTLRFEQYIPKESEQRQLAAELQAAIKEAGFDISIDTTSIAMARNEGGRFLEQVR